MGVQKRHENEDEPFDEVMDGLKHQLGIEDDTDLTEEALRELIKRYFRLIKERTGKTFPQDPFKQLIGAVGAVFGSWMNERAILSFLIPKMAPMGDNRVHHKAINFEKRICGIPAHTRYGRRFQDQEASQWFSRSIPQLLNRLFSQ